MAYVCSKVSFRLGLRGSLQSYDSGRSRSRGSLKYKLKQRPNSRDVIGGA